MKSDELQEVINWLHNDVDKAVEIIHWRKVSFDMGKLCSSDNFSWASVGEKSL